MFTDFLYILRAYGVPVGTNEWLAFQDALKYGLENGNIKGLYYLARSILIKSEALYDAYDRAFAVYFQGLDISLELKEALANWLENPMRKTSNVPPSIFENEQKMFEEFQRLLKEQKERHDGGNRWIGTGGTSAFGNSGSNPAGIRIGGQSGQRSAVYIAEERQFQNYRTDVVLETRHFKVALKNLRRLKNDGNSVFQLEQTIKKTAENAGEIDIVFGPDRSNSVKLLLLMDAGGSMDPYVETVSRLFTAANSARHFKSFSYYYFHNCVYGRLYSDISRRISVPTDKVLNDLDGSYRVIFVGDACMADWELHAGNFGLNEYRTPSTSGVEWLKRIKKHFKNAVWLNPENHVYWNHSTIAQVRAIFPMYELTLDGLKRAMRHLKIDKRFL